VTASVALVSLDDLVFQREIAPPTLVKIDVEGAELDVLLGMEQVLQRVKPLVLYELDDESETGLRRKAAACESQLRALGYNITQLPDSYTGMSWRVKHYLATPS
jgi:hypothetical protein